MTDEPTATEGIHASTAPELPPLPGTFQPATLLFAEGSGQGLPACSPALPEDPPLTSVAKNVYTSTSTKQHEDLPGVGQAYLLAAQDLVSAAAAQPQSPEKHSLMKEREETPEAVEQPTASSPSDERARKTVQPVRPRMAGPFFSPTGPQSTHGSSVGMGTPSFLPVEGVGSYDRSGGKVVSRQGSSSPAPGSRLAIARTTGQFVQTRADAAKSPGISPGGQGQLKSAQPCVVDLSHLLSTPAETWPDVTNIQPHFKHGMASSPDSEQTDKSDECTSPPPSPSLLLASSAERCLPISLPLLVSRVGSRYHAQKL